MDLPHVREPAADKAHGLSKDDQLGGTIDLDATPQSTSTQDRRPVHVHSDLVGFVIVSPNGFEAITVGGLQLGRFNSSDAAARALANRAAKGCCDAG